MEGLEGAAGTHPIVDRLMMFSKRDTEVVVDKNISTILVAGANIVLNVNHNYGYINVCVANCKVIVQTNYKNAVCEDQGARNEIIVQDYSDQEYNGYLNVVPVEIQVNGNR